MTVTNRKNRKYSVVPYQESWAQDFQRIESELKPVFGDLAIAFEHVGSTAVEGMSGKATIDVLIVVRNIQDVDALNEKMEKLGYTPLGDYIEQDGRLFAKEANGERLVNVHCSEQGHAHIEEMIVMRDFLRSHPAEAKEYTELKLDLFAKHPDDYIAYRAVKDPYLQEMKKRAFAWSEKRIPQPQKHIALYGPPGAGKSTVIAFAKTIGWNAVDFEDVGANLEERKKALSNLAQEGAPFALFGAADIPPEVFPSGTVFVLLAPAEDVLIGRVQHRNDTRAHKWIEHAKKVRNEHLQMAKDGVFQMVITEDFTPEDILKKLSVTYEH